MGLITVEENEKRLLALLAHNVLELWRSCLVGNPAQGVVERFEKMKKYQPGDYVLEISLRHNLSNYLEVYDRLQASMGIYLGKALNEIRDPEDPEDVTYVEVHYIQNFNGSLMMWSNCNFVRILESGYYKDMYTEEQVRNSRVKRGFRQCNLGLDEVGVIYQKEGTAPAL